MKLPHVVKLWLMLERPEWVGARIEITPAGRAALLADKIAQFTPGVVAVDPRDLFEPSGVLLCADPWACPVCRPLLFADATGAP